MKKITQLFPIIALAILVSIPSIGQKRSSPKANAENKVGDLTISMVYFQPGVDGRTIYGDLVPYGKVWRTGANDATTFEVNKDVTISGQKLAAGKYSIFTVPGEKEWTVIFNSDNKQWGAYSYKEGKDALRITVKPKKTKELVERMTFNIDDNGKVDYNWENLTFSFDVKSI